MKISYKSVSDILSPKEMKNVKGGSGGGGGYGWHCCYWAYNAYVRCDPSEHCFHNGCDAGWCEFLS